MARTKRKTPWEKADPKPPAKRKHLTPAQKSKAAARARRAGRPYPNLVDNMAVARTSTKTAGKKKTARKFGAKKSARTKGATKTRTTKHTAVRKRARTSGR